MDNNNQLKVISLGGWSGVTQNMFAWETPKEILLIDCGIGFPEETSGEKEVLIPDINYLKSRKEKIKGIIISHGHLDHYGALPFILPEINYPPIYASRLVKGFIEARMAEFNLSQPKINLIEFKGDFFNVGSFKIHSFRVNHSVPDSAGFCIETPAGKIFHVSDFKFDFTPVDSKVFQIARAVQLARPPVLALFSDCLGSVHPDFTSSEREIEKMFNQIIGETKGQLLITTLSSNISRFQQAIKASLRQGRKLVLVGRSVEEKIKIARRLGYLQLKNQDVVVLKNAKKMSSRKLTRSGGGFFS